MTGMGVTEWVAVFSIGVNAILAYVTMSVKTEVTKLRAEIAETYLSKGDFDRLSRFQKEH